MRARRLILPGAALAACLSPSGCRGIDGLGGLTFDVSTEGGAGAPAADPPEGWSGPVAVYEGPPGTSPGCPDAYPTPVLDGGTSLASVPAATCAACSCGTPPVTCAPGPVLAHGKSTCGGTATTTPLVAGTCTPFDPGSDAFEVGSPSSNVGPCAPAGGEATLAALSWSTEAVVCGLAAPGPICANGACDPPQAPFEARTCIWRAGTHACPAPFPDARAWASAADSRACAPCTCAAPSVSSCSVTTTVFTSGTCSVSPTVVPPGQCTTLPSIQSVLATTTLTDSPTCGAGGGNATGTATAGATLTICCPGAGQP